MSAQTFATVGLRLIAVYFVVYALPVLPSMLVYLYGPQSLSGREDLYIHHTYFVAASLQPPPVTACAYLLLGVLLLVFSHFFARLLCRGLGPAA